MGTVKGVYKYNTIEKTYAYYGVFDANKMAIDNIGITALHKDRKGIFWIGTDELRMVNKIYSNLREYAIFRNL